MKDRVCCNCLSSVDRVVAPVVCDECADLLRGAEERPSLRDRFAMAALSGLVMRGEYDHEHDWETQYARASYGLADALLKAREESNG